MNDIKELLQIDFVAFFVTIFIIISAIVSIVGLVGKFCNIIGKPLKWFNKQNQDHELLIATANMLNELQKHHEEDVQQSIRHDEMIREDLKKLTDIFIDKEIDDLRWEIINVADKISDGKTVSKECYKHCFRTYDKYEKIIEKYHLTNNEVSASIDIIRKSYVDNGYK